jgi:hypothetical protein
VAHGELKDQGYPNTIPILHAASNAYSLHNRKIFYIHFGGKYLQYFIMMVMCLRGAFMPGELPKGTEAAAPRETHL